MADTTLLLLPLLAAAQAQKHVTHNDALLRLDALVQLAVIDRDLTAPPGSPSDGDRYIPASGATGDWAGWDLNIAWYVDGVWSKLVPREGWLAWVADEDALLVWDGAAWSALGGGGGGAVDSVFGRAGAVSAQAGDYEDGQITAAASATNYTPTGASVEGHLAGIDTVLGAGGGGGGGLTLTEPSEVATTSGTAVGITGLSGAKIIRLGFEGISTDGTSLPIIQIGDAGGYETSGYLAAGTRADPGSGAGAGTSTAGFVIAGGWGGASLSFSGFADLSLLDAGTNLWACQGLIYVSNGAPYAFAGTKALSGALDRIQLTTVGGTDTFDAGKLHAPHIG